MNRFPQRLNRLSSKIQPSVNQFKRLIPLPRRYYSSRDDQTRISTLPNGVRVTTESTPGHFIGAGVYIDAGSRYESDRLRGTTHLTDRMAFKSTENRTAEQISLEIEQLGGSFFASSGRDTVVYQATSYPDALPSVMSVLSDTTLNPLLLQSELSVEQEAAEWEVNEINKKPEYMIPELLHEIAYPNNTLGLPLICPSDRIWTITPEILWEYRKLFYRPDRIVVAGVGVEHDDFLRHTERYFGKFRSVQPPQNLGLNPALNSPSAPQSSTSNVTTTVTSSSSSVKPNLSKAFATAANVPVSLDGSISSSSLDQLVSPRPVYRGGELRLPDSTESNLAHVYVGFEAPSVHDDDLYAIACVHIMLGGGSSFSAGGPGKGMYSRLYTGVLNPHPEVDFCQAFHHTYADSGLFGIAIAVTPEFASMVPQILASQLDEISRAHTRGGITESQLRRAKNQLRSTMMYGLESRLLQVEDLGRQVQTAGRKKPWPEVWERIEALTIKDINRAVSRIIRPESGGFSGEPTIVATGQIERLGDVKKILSRYGIGSLADRSKTLW
ncbi:mitochondrial-processing peptidase subunit alpha [Phakopsora pachyrhizi]|nr:mitochondrial-processing peptidase subunit alpha [Phakopsora pachyrhizi]